MKHEREWYTCDRCGKNVEDLVEAWKWKIGNILKPKGEVLDMIQSEPYGYVTEEIHKLPDTSSVTIVRGYKKKQETIHLCSKCKKAFERFMKNKE